MGKSKATWKSELVAGERSVRQEETVWTSIVQAWVSGKLNPQRLIIYIMSFLDFGGVGPGGVFGVFWLLFCGSGSVDIVISLPDVWG